jgi:predicted TIM-barrel fold metal-dependent hydrolase
MGIEKFGASRGRFESNLPVDKNFTSYPTLWNAFKRLAAAYSPAGRRALLAGTAAATYRL